ncbi:hypothetical protein UXN85_20930 [Enterobacter hormaechei]
MNDLDPLELLEHTGRLGELADSVIAEEDPLEKLDGIQEMVGIFDVLGVGGAAPAATEEPEPEEEGPPAIVQEFLSGRLDGQESTQFLETLRILDEYVGHYLTLQDVIDGAERWWQATGAAEAAA